MNPGYKKRASNYVLSIQTSGMKLEEYSMRPSFLKLNLHFTFDTLSRSLCHMISIHMGQIKSPLQLYNNASVSMEGWWMLGADHHISKGSHEICVHSVCSIINLKLSTLQPSQMTLANLKTFDTFEHMATF